MTDGTMMILFTSRMPGFLMDYAATRMRVTTFSVCHRLEDVKVSVSGRE